MSVSLLQLARAYTVFTNEGQLLPLSLVKREALPIGKPVLKRETTQELTRMMEMAVLPGGTAPRAQVPGYRVAGKTGPRTSPRRAATPSTSTCPPSWASAR
jgi:cell division protein FtsI (penicillin-binding protein 3)